jgi:hypothetical protein
VRNAIYYTAERGITGENYLITLRDSPGVSVIDNFPFLSIKSGEMEFKNV